jgi:hypothetical protein
MSEPKFTSGPWGLDGNINLWVMAGKLHVATIPRASDGDWSQANANLIAAAPDLYHALTKARELIRHLTSREDHLGDMAKDAAIAADAALAKAIGKGGQ